MKDRVCVREREREREKERKKERKRENVGMRDSERGTECMKDRESVSLVGSEYECKYKREYECTYTRE